MRDYNYNRADFAEALRSVGAKTGDILFSHSNIGYFGYPAEGKSSNIACQTIFDAVFDVIGDTGTLVVPAFTYSFARGQDFDIQHTPSTMGIFAEWVRHHPDGMRSQDPLFSVVAVGHRAREMVHNVPMNCFGEDSFWERFYKVDGLIANFNFDTGSTYIHYIERCLNVPYRYEKPFTGNIIGGGVSRPERAIFYCRDMTNPDTDASFEYLDEIAMRDGVVKLARVGRGEIKGIRAQAKYRYIADTLTREPWFLTTAHTRKISPILSQITSEKIELADKNMLEQLQVLSHIERGTMTDGYDLIINTLGLDVKTFPTGTLFKDLYVPEKWELISAKVSTLDGQEVLSHSYHPLQVMGHSRPVNKRISRTELLQHIHTHPTAIPSVERFGITDWGLSASEEQIACLNEAEYHVNILTRFTFHELRIGYWYKDFGAHKTIVVYTHLGSSGQANFGLSGVMVMREVMHKLEQSPYNIMWVVSPMAFWGIECTTADLVILLDEVGHHGTLHTVLHGTAMNEVGEMFVNDQTKKSIAHSNFNEATPVIKITRDLTYPERHTHLDTYALTQQHYLEATITWLLNKFEGN